MATAAGVGTAGVDGVRDGGVGGDRSSETPRSRVSGWGEEEREQVRGRREQGRVGASLSSRGTRQRGDRNRASAAWAREHWRHSGGRR